MIKYPFLKEGATIGVTAPSSGVPESLHEMFKLACSCMESKGFQVKCGDTVWTQDKAKSASGQKRAAEFHGMMSDAEINIIIPPWGGELAIEVLEHLDINSLKEKWVLGYSDTSLLLLAITLNTGIATAHGANFVDLRGEYSDEITAMWQSVLMTKVGESVLQQSSDKYQKTWQHANPTPCVFHLTEPTCWKTVSKNTVHIEGHLLGGCIDIIRHLIGTPYGDVEKFRNTYLKGDSIIWYLENCEMTTTDLRRSLVQMKLAGWFTNCSGIMFGRSAANQPVDDYTVEDVYQDLAEELQIPIIYDIDCGHQPPQMTFINGSYAEVNVGEGKGTVLQIFKK